MSKVCVRCGLEKSESEFVLKKYGRKAYLRNTCRICYDALRKNHEGEEKPEGRVCNKCREYKPIVAFPKQRQCLYGIEPVCKACKIKRRREYVLLFPERAKNADLKYQYGITLEEYEAMHARQGGRCAICGTAEAKLVVDHEHVTRRVRSLLCHLCNAMIGCAREDAAILAAGIGYLRRHAEGVSAELLGEGIVVTSGAGDAPLP